MILLIFFLFFAIYGSEPGELIKDIKALPTDMVEKIIGELSNLEKLPLRFVSKKFYEFASDVKERDSYINYVARTNVFNEDFDLDYFERPDTKIPNHLRKEVSEQYQKLMKDSVFFL